jgi:hypothetical protein
MGIAAIVDVARVLGDAELRAMTSTGRSCTYLPDPRRPRRWSVRAAS